MRDWSPLNCYTCDACAGKVITIDRDEGVTPFMMLCRATDGCRGTMRSSFYRGVVGTPTFEWRRPTLQEYAEASEGMKRHFNEGGLDIYKIDITGDKK